jgi:hypothetical protein
MQKGPTIVKATSLYARGYATKAEAAIVAR